MIGVWAEMADYDFIQTSDGLMRTAQLRLLSVLESERRFAWCWIHNCCHFSHSYQQSQFWTCYLHTSENCQLQTAHTMGWTSSVLTPRELLSTLTSEQFGTCDIQHVNSVIWRKITQKITEKQKDSTHDFTLYFGKHVNINRFPGLTPQPDAAGSQVSLH